MGLCKHANRRTRELLRHELHHHCHERECGCGRRYLMMELFYKPSDQIQDQHDLGIFVKLSRTYCTACVAGQGGYRHRSERLWYHYHHWTEERLGMNRLVTIRSCSSTPEGTALIADVQRNLHSQHTVKHATNIEEQIEKMQ